MKHRTAALDEVGEHLVQRGEARMGARAEATPLVVGRKGSPTELVLASLYFRADVPETIPYAEVARVEKSARARAIGAPSVGDPCAA